jgi:hypothetical protein
LRLVVQYAYVAARQGKRKLAASDDLFESSYNAWTFDDVHGLRGPITGGATRAIQRRGAIDRTAGRLLPRDWRLQIVLLGAVRAGDCQPAI